jgi:hypothetical protein
MKLSSISMSKGKGKKAKHGPVRSTTIGRAKNGFMVSKEHEPMPDADGNPQYLPSEPPAVFNNADDAHAYSAQQHAEPDADDSDAGAGTPASGDAA